MPLINILKEEDPIQILVEHLNKTAKLDDSRDSSVTPEYSIARDCNHFRPPASLFRHQSALWLQPFCPYTRIQPAWRCDSLIGSGHISFNMFSATSCNLVPPPPLRCTALHEPWPPVLFASTSLYPRLSFSILQSPSLVGPLEHLTFGLPFLLLV
jgi:hypothetical protein